MLVLHEHLFCDKSKYGLQYYACAIMNKEGIYNDTNLIIAVQVPWCSLFCRGQPGHLINPFRTNHITKLSPVIIKINSFGSVIFHFLLFLHLCQAFDPFQNYFNAASVCHHHELYFCRLWFCFVCVNVHVSAPRRLHAFWEPYVSGWPTGIFQLHVLQCPQLWLGFTSSIYCVYTHTSSYPSRVIQFH